VYEPFELGVNVTVQLTVVPLPERVQLLGENPPEPLLAKVTDPVGVMDLPGLISVTVTVQTIGLLRV
jgi:hypothetical protein